MDLDEFKTACYNFGALASGRGYRNAHNRVPPNISAARATPGWTQMPPAQSVFHQRGPNGKGNTKWIDENGQCEAVYNDDGDLVTDRLNGGTFNFASPDENPIDHVMLDVIPYLMWGNGPITIDQSMFSAGEFE